MKTLACVFLALAVLSGLASSWCLMGCLSWSAMQAWTWNEEDDDGLDADEE